MLASRFVYMTLRAGLDAQLRNGCLTRWLRFGLLATSRTLEIF